MILISRVGTKPPSIFNFIFFTFQIIFQSFQHDSFTRAVFAIFCIPVNNFYYFLNYIHVELKAGFITEV